MRLSLVLRIRLVFGLGLVSWLRTIHAWHERGEQITSSDITVTLRHYVDLHYSVM